MSEKTNISWADSTINFWRGCTKVSPGCKFCYAETLVTTRLQGEWGKGKPRQKGKGAISDALAFNRKPWICDECGHAQVESYEESPCKKCFAGGLHRRRIFSLSLGDWLDDEVPIEWLAEMLDTIRKCDQVTWILCTKRPENFGSRMLSVLASVEQINGDWPDCFPKTELGAWLNDWEGGESVPPHVILLASVENQQTADERIPQLLKIPAACRGLSCEPLLGPVNLLACRHPQHHGEFPDGIDWLIIGGESGTDARPCNVEWIRSLVAQGKAAGVKTFVKQLGALPQVDHDAHADGRVEAGEFHYLKLKDKKGGDPSEWSPDLRVQEWPL